jgi:diguanylate cyclase
MAMTRRSPFRLARRQALRNVLLALGPGRMTIALTLLATLSTVFVGQLALLVVGPAWPVLAVLVTALCSAVVVPLFVWPVLRLWADADATCERLGVLATRDDLTGALNRRQFLALAEREWARCERYGMSASLLMIDVDHFKRINDNHGHLAGDLMLREIAHAASGLLRHADLFGRFGGEEFIVYLPHTDTLGALDAADRIRDAVARLALEWRGQTMRATVSVGVVSIERHHDALGALIADADVALYAAKDAGRNCVRTAQERPRHNGEETHRVVS